MYDGLEVVVDNASYLAAHDPVEFAMVRRKGFGASDSSVLLGVNLYTKLKELLEQKASTTVTDKELKIGQLPQVKAGNDLEPIILQKFINRFGVELEKPKAMYRMTTHPQLTMNFDGVMNISMLGLIPVEAKYISVYGGKYYDFTKAIDRLLTPPPLVKDLHETIQEHIEYNASNCGIPGYYYTQVQQQILGLDAPFGYLTCLNHKDWEYRTFIIPRDERVIKVLIERSYEEWDNLQKVKMGLA